MSDDEVAQTVSRATPRLDRGPARHKSGAAMSTSNSVPPVELLVAANEDAAVFYRQQLIGSADLDRAGTLRREALPSSWRTPAGPLASRRTDGQTSATTCRRSGTRMRPSFPQVSRPRSTRDAVRPVPRTDHLRHPQWRSDNWSASARVQRPTPWQRAEVPEHARHESVSEARRVVRSRRTLGSRRSGSRVVVVEGPLDAIAVDFCSPTAPDHFVALALCGTALSATHAEHIHALSPTAVVVVLDEDGAGRAGRERAYLQLRECVTDLLCPTLPSGSDPADVLLASGPLL